MKEVPLSHIIQDQVWRYIGQRRVSDDGSGRICSEDMRIAAKGKRASRRVIPPPSDVSDTTNCEVISN